MDQSSIATAVKQICDEKGITVESVVSTIEAALAAAYRKDFGEKNQNIKAEFDLETGQTKIFDVKEVVEDIPEDELDENGEQIIPEKEESEAAEGEDEEEVKRFNPKTQLQVKDAKALDKKWKVGDEIVTPLEIPGDFGRMAAQTAKQVIVQKLRETERATMYEEFKDKQGEILVGTIQRREGKLVLVDLGRLTALLPPEEQIRGENYTPGSHVKVYILSVKETTKGPEVLVSRAHPEIVKTLFFLEIPEIANGTVEIKAVSREAGARSKVAVHTEDENIDPIGSCIGQRGARIQTIISELKGEKVDIIKYSDDPAEYISNALSPAKITEMKIDEEEKVATAIVAEDQLSLAIGKAGQNVRLAARLTGWKIDIESTEGEVIDEEKIEEIVEEEEGEEGEEKPAEEESTEEVTEEKDNKEDKEEEKEEKAEEVEEESKEEK